jgi:hypothetical protein
VQVPVTPVVVPAIELDAVAEVISAVKVPIEVRLMLVYGRWSMSMPARISVPAVIGKSTTSPNGEIQHGSESQNDKFSHDFPLLTSPRL